MYVFLLSIYQDSKIIPNYNDLRDAPLFLQTSFQEKQKDHYPTMIR